MLKNNWKKKFVAMLLIFTLTFGNFALVGKTYAASILDAFSDDKGDTGSSNVEFDANFVILEENDEEQLDGEEQKTEIEDEAESESEEVIEEASEESTSEENEIAEEDSETAKSKDEENKIAEESKEVKADINTDVLRLKLNVKVLNSGYLKDAKIILGNGEELNFEVNSGNFENDNVQSFEDNNIELTQMNAGSDVELIFPISYDGGSYVELDKISKSNVIKFEGTYVDGEEETSVSKEVNLSLLWQDERETSVTSEVTKYINYSSDGTDGVILQVLVKANNETDNSKLPVESSSIDIDVPTINGVKPESVKVVANSLLGTTGKDIGEVEFSEDNWNYNKEDNKLDITVQTESELVSLQDENEVLIDETAEKKEAYYAGSGTDEYLVTYVYNNVSLESLNLTSNITSTFNMYGGTELVQEEKETYELKDQIGDIVTFSTKTETESVSKGYTYLNYNNEESKYEIEIDNKLIFNISYKDIVSGLHYEDGTNYYVSNSGETFEQNDIYYKSLKISKNNFDEILGETGYINIYDINGNLLITINNESEVKDDGNYEINFDSSVKWIRIETSSPISEGNLVFSTIRAYKDVSFNKEAYKTFNKISLNSVAKANYTYLEDLVDCGNSNIDIKLEDTKTNATLVIGQESLSTLAMNNQVEMKIELNNDKILSDVYGESEFIVKMPEYIETVEITDYSIVYGEGLEISNIEAYEENGSIYLKINVIGTQKSLSSGIVSNGTNIVLNANIKVDLYAPSATKTFELTYTNNEATSYASEKDGKGYSKADVKYSAPSGVVSVNSISGYNDKGETVTSVKQGKKVGNLDIYSSSKTAKMELVVMNNEVNSISNISILGRTIYKGNKDLLTNEDLGTTLDSPMVSGITCDQNNGVDFTVYYSENGDATNDLNNSANGWTTEVSDWSLIRSYLIVPNDSNYQMEVASKLHFTYEFVIPENLPHNEDLYGTFGTYYTNNTEVATLNETSVADLVGISTGVGPELEISTSANLDTVNEFSEFEFTTVVKNIGKVTAKNLVVEVPVPTYTSYVESEVDDKVTTTSDTDKIVYTLEELKTEEEIKIVTKFEVNEVYETENLLTVYSTVTADDLGAILESDKIQIKTIDAEIKVNIYDATPVGGKTLKKDDEFVLNISVTNLTDNTLNNVKISTYIEEPIEVSSVQMYDDNYNLVELGEYDSSTRTYNWKIDSLESGDNRSYELYLKVGDLTGTELLKKIEFRATAKADETNEYNSKAVNFNVGKYSLLIKQTSKTTNTYVKEGELIEYVFSITNEGTTVAKSVTLTDQVPKGLVIKEIKYFANGEEVVRRMSESEEAIANISINAGETKEVTVVAAAQNLNGVQELLVTNVGSVTTENDTLTSNSVTHIIESDGNGTVIGESSSAPATSETTSDNLRRTYNITGIAWLDSNKDGARDDSEQLLKGITATLVNSDTGVIKQTAVTNSDGEYKFSGVESGNYIIIFDYDTTLYTVTTYQKENIASNINSDVISTKIEQDGKYRNGAVTDVVTISDGSISNIDIGLVEAMKFDLSLDMGITKITVQNSKGTSTDNYDFASLTKTEVSQRYLAGSEIYVEYTFRVKNEGEVSGYASKIANYIPDGMKFNSGLNSDWYTGTDGNLYTTTLANTEIAPGETKEFTLVLSKTMTNENTGRVSNTAEIIEDYNIYGISDIDSTPGNNNQNEDDFARADAILGVGTGSIYVYISVAITTILLVGTGIFIIVLKRKNKVIKGGV